MSYKKIKAPEPKEGKMVGMAIRTQVIIERIDFIDTVGMVMGLTIKLKMKWNDMRLTFNNLIPHEPNLITKDVGERC